MDNILDFIRDYYLEHSLMPSTTQIADAMGIARGTAYKYLVAMDERGMLQYSDGEIATESMAKIRGSLFPGIEENMPVNCLVLKTFLQS